MNSFEIELHTHLTSKTNSRAARFGKFGAAKIAKAQRDAVRVQIEQRMRRLHPMGQAYVDEPVGPVKIDPRTGLPKLKIRRRLSPAWRARLDAGIVVTFTRVSGRRLDKEDNLREAFKSYKDGVADAFGTHDGNGEKRLTWEYAEQIIGTPSRVIIRIEWRDGERA